MITQLEKTPIVEVACGRVGISRMTHYRWLKQDPDYATLVKKAMDEGVSVISDAAETQLINLIKTGSLGAVVHWLRHHHPAYANRLHVSLEKADEELTPEEEEEVRRAQELAALNSDGHEPEKRTGNPGDDALESPPQAEHH